MVGIVDRMFAVIEMAEVARSVMVVDIFNITLIMISVIT